VISAVAATEKETMTVSFVKEKMQKIMATLDSSGDGKISKEEFGMILQNDEAVACLQDVDVDVEGLVDLADFIFNDDVTGEEKEPDFSDFMEIILGIRGSNSATVKDIMDLRKFVYKQNCLTTEKLVKLDETIIASGNGIAAGNGIASTMVKVELDAAPTMPASHDPAQVRDWMEHFEDSLNAGLLELQKLSFCLSSEIPSANTTATTLPGNVNDGPESPKLQDGLCVPPEGHQTATQSQVAVRSIPHRAMETHRAMEQSEDLLLREQVKKLAETVAVGLGDVKKVRESMTFKPSAVPFLMLTPRTLDFTSTIVVPGWQGSLSSRSSLSSGQDIAPRTARC